MHLRLNRASSLLGLALLASGGIVFASSWHISRPATAQEAESQPPLATPSPIVREVSPRNVRERPMASGETGKEVSPGETALAGASTGDAPSAGEAASSSEPRSPAVATRENETVTVMVDHAKVVRLPDRTQTVIVGNPMVADITIQRNGIIVVTGKSYGATNLIALDSAGMLLAESRISVQAPVDSVVTVQRGLARESYSCTPTCQPSLRLGDSQDYFGAVGNQTTQRNTLATQR